MYYIYIYARLQSYASSGKRVIKDKEGGRMNVKSIIFIIIINFRGLKTPLHWNSTAITSKHKQPSHLYVSS